MNFEPFAWHKHTTLDSILVLEKMPWIFVRNLCSRPHTIFSIASTKTPGKALNGGRRMGWNERARARERYIDKLKVRNEMAKMGKYSVIYEHMSCASI